MNLTEFYNSAVKAAVNRGFCNPNDITVHAMCLKSGPSYSVNLWVSNDKKFIYSKHCKNPEAAIQSIKDEIEYYYLSYTNTEFNMPL